ncbi:MAG: TIGR03960 family B12-binding radical SAM protein [Planctomycetota bacterium]
MDKITDPQAIHRILTDRILSGVEMPARYTGGEVNAVRKDPAAVEASFALLFPDVYQVGMSHLGYQILYGVLNELDWAAAERAYAVWPDMRKAMGEHGIPLYALESFRPVREFDVVAFSFQYELLATNVLDMLELAGVPLPSAERGAEDPVVIAGGPGAACPEPMAEFIDLFFPGDGEEVIVEFAELVRGAKRAGARRDEVVRRAAREIKGAYAPALYQPRYGPQGRFQGMEPSSDGIPERVPARKVVSLKGVPFPLAPVVPFVETVHDRITLEIMRGCTRGCRFCQAGMLRRPVRTRPMDDLLEQVDTIYRNTGWDEVGLTSLSSSDYPRFRELLDRVNARAEPCDVNITLSSLRVDDQLRTVPEELSRVRKSGLTVAPEAGTERLRRVINKDVTDEKLLEGARAAFREGWRHIKLYFMIGLPTETDEDVAAIVELSERVSRVRKEVAEGRGRVNVSIAPFVPKPHTPFQWEGMDGLEELRRKRGLVLERARLRSVRYSFHEPERSLLEAALARGDRRMGRVILRAYREGARFDAWDEHFEFDLWRRCFAEEGMSLEEQATRERDEEECLPWCHIDFGLTRQFLLRERQKALRGEMTPDCRTGQCTVCGVCTDLMDR